MRSSGATARSSLHNRRTLRVRRALLIVAAVVAAVATSLSGSAARTVVGQPARGHQLTRYSLAHGCYALRTGRSGPVAGGPFRMQTAALATYLLYTPSGQYLNDSGRGLRQAAATPSAASEWRVDGRRLTGFELTNLS